jgi:hypothetical protein
MLSLSEIQQWHHSRFLVLWRVSLQDLIDELFVLCRELEWKVGIVIGGIAMLINLVRSRAGYEGELRGGWRDLQRAGRRWKLLCWP